MPTTAATARPYRRLTAVPNTGPIVQASAKPNTTTTAGTGLRLFPPVRQTRPVLTSLTALPKFRAGAAIPDMKNQEARALKTTPVTTVRRLFQVVQATQAALTSQIVRPKSAPGLVTQDIKSQEILV